MLEKVEVITGEEAESNVLQVRRVARPAPRRSNSWAVTQPLGPYGDFSRELSESQWTSCIALF